MMIKINRKIYHIAGLLFPIIMAVFSKKTALYASGTLFLGILFLDALRLEWKGFNLWILKKLPLMFKAQEVKRISASPYYLGGVFFTLLLFDPATATGGIIFLSVGDLAAVTIGRNFGRIRLFHKTIEGTMAFAISTIIVLSLLKVFGILYVGALSYKAIVIGSVLCAILEILPLEIDDNLTLPIVGAFILKLLS